MSYIYNYNKLKGRIVEKLRNQSIFAERMKLSETTIYSKLNGKIEFRQSEILDACNILDIEMKDMPNYFFDYKVKKNLIKSPQPDTKQGKEERV